MLKKILKTAFAIIGITTGYVVGMVILKLPEVQNINKLSSSVVSAALIVFFCLLFGIMFYIISPKLYKGIMITIDYIEKNIQKLTIGEITYGAIGALVSLAIVGLATRPLISFNKYLGPLVVFFINIIAAYMGMHILIKRREDINNLLINIRKNTFTREKKLKGNGKSSPKVLDTSVIIDGRIFDICETGFIEGPLIIPNFVLDELRHISDSADGLKRVRGRRGLDILNKIQKELSIETQIWEGDFSDIAEVDSKLLKLAQTINGKVITNDYNLNKVAEVQGVPVLNINELSNAIKPVAISGEEMEVEVVKDGKEASQGVAYLDDGTMIVIEDGKKHVGSVITVVVTSVLQTAAGRMIFAKAKEM